MNQMSKTVILLAIGAAVVLRAIAVVLHRLRYKHYAMFVGEEGFNPVWADMAQGKYHADVRPVTTPAGQTLVFRHNFMPICDKDGKLTQVMLFAFLEKCETINNPIP